MNCLDCTCKQDIAKIYGDSQIWCKRFAITRDCRIRCRHRRETCGDCKKCEEVGRSE